VTFVAQEGQRQQKSPVLSWRVETTKMQELLASRKIRIYVGSA
jgi:hypothetical protein